MFLHFPILYDRSWANLMPNFFLSNKRNLLLIPLLSVKIDGGELEMKIHKKYQ